MAPAGQKVPATEEKPGVPLRCSICDGEPGFTDKSHLLTHISSKGHLAQRQKLELRCYRDAESRRLLAEYDAWYQRWGLQRALEERQLAKDQAEEAERRGLKAKRPRKTRTAAPADDEDDESVKTEPRGPSQDDEFTDDEAEADAPAAKRRSGRIGNATPHGERPATDVVEVATLAGSVEVSDANLLDPLIEQEVEDKLKGVRHPGMGIFDSATDGQKKRRNQKKDASVLQSMLRTSATVPRDYHVWGQDGAHQRSRDIYATPSVDGSPERDLNNSSDKKKRTRKAKTSSAASKSAAAAKSKNTDSEDLDESLFVEPASGPGRHSHPYPEHQEFQGYHDYQGYHNELMAQFGAIRPGREAAQAPNRPALGNRDLNVSSSGSAQARKAKKATSGQNSSAAATQIEFGDDPLAFPRRAPTTLGNPFSVSRHNPDGYINPLRMQQPQQADLFGNRFVPTAPVADVRATYPNAGMPPPTAAEHRALQQLRNGNGNMGNAGNDLTWTARGPTPMSQNLARLAMMGAMHETMGNHLGYHQGNMGNADTYMDNYIGTMHVYGDDNTNASIGNMDDYGMDGFMANVNGVTDNIDNTDEVVDGDLGVMDQVVDNMANMAGGNVPVANMGSANYFDGLSADHVLVAEDFLDAESFAGLQDLDFGDL